MPPLPSRRTTSQRPIIAPGATACVPFIAVIVCECGPARSAGAETACSSVNLVAESRVTNPPVAAVLAVGGDVSATAVVAVPRRTAPSNTRMTPSTAAPTPPNIAGLAIAGGSTGGST